MAHQFLQPCHLPPREQDHCLDGVNKRHSLMQYFNSKRARDNDRTTQPPRQNCLFHLPLFMQTQRPPMEGKKTKIHRHPTTLPGRSQINDTFPQESIHGYQHEPNLFPAPSTHLQIWLMPFRTRRLFTWRFCMETGTPRTVSLPHI